MVPNTLSVPFDTAPPYDNPKRKDRRDDPTAPPCRDWLMGVCDRGKCMFYHPNTDDPRHGVENVICQDYEVWET